MDFSKPSFSAIREELVNYLKKSDDFLDYSFQGSTMGHLVDALAYTLLQLRYYTNFSVQECFLESASQRNNVTSHARILGYMPNQMLASKATVKLYYTGSRPIEIRNNPLVKAGLKFIGTNDNGKYEFITEKDAYFEEEEDGRFGITLDLINGRWVEESFTQDEYESTKCILSNPCVLDTLKVTFINSVTDNESYVMNLASDISDFKPDANLYYLQESYSGYVEIYFGDGQLSKKFEEGNVVNVKYLVCSGKDANEIIQFALDERINNIDTSYFSIEVIDPSYGGGDKESIESIKFNAPRYYQRQDRNVTVTDYSNAILTKFGSIVKALTVWGGEDNDPPDYGSVYIAILPQTGVTLSDKFKETIKKELQQKCLPCIRTKVVEPKIVYTSMGITCDWWANQSKLTESEVRNKITETANQYFDEVFSGFKAYYRDAKLIKTIYDIDDKLEDVLITKTFYQYFNAYTFTSQYYTINFNNNLEPGSILIGPWTTKLGQEKVIIDDGEGNLYEYYNQLEIRGNKVGTLDYSSGLLSINNYDFGLLSAISLKCKATPLTSNIQMRNHYLLSLDSLTVNINNLSIVEY